MSKTLLAGDVGATKTELALFVQEGAKLKFLTSKRYVSKDYADLQPIVEDFLTNTDTAATAIEAASIGIAGPVLRGRVKTTNLPWQLDQESLRTSLKLKKLVLLNDMEAMAYGIQSLPEKHTCVLQTGKKEPTGTRAVIAAGTGLGEAILVRQGDRWVALASEGGHADFAPTTETEIDLLRFLKQELDHVSYERVASGLGLLNIYRFLKSAGLYEEPVWLAKKLEEEPVPTLVKLGLEDDPKICGATLDLFVGILAAEAGNLALKCMATGGVYLAGGMVTAMIPRLQEKDFVARFQAKGRYADLLSGIPIVTTNDPLLALRGAAEFTMLGDQ